MAEIHTLSDHRVTDLYQVGSVVEDYPAKGATFHGVTFSWFVNKRPKPIGNYGTLIERHSTLDEQDRAYTEGHVEELFTLSEATALKAYLDSTMRGHETAIAQVSLPVPTGIIGCGAVAVGGMTDFYMLSDTPGYDLPIKVWGYLDLRGLPYTPDVETAMVAGAAVPF